MIWVEAETQSQIHALCALCARMEADGERPVVIVTGAARAAAERAGLPVAPTPANRAEADALLQHWTPDVLLWGSNDLHPKVLAEADRHGLPSLFIDAGAQGRLPNAGWRPGQLRKRLRSFSRVLAASDKARSRLVRIGAAPDRCETVGRFSDAPPPPDHNAAELSDMIRIIGPRPVWLALDVPPGEIAGVLAAHRHAARHSPRLLLILVPERPDDPITETALSQSPFLIARRDAGQDPEEQHHILLADIGGETGLWLRLAPVSYMGGTLSGTGHPDPFAAAALGTAIIHGHRSPPELQDAYDGLARAGATRMIADMQALPQALTTLLAPDRAAQMATTAWEVATAGAPTLNRVEDLLIEIRDGAPV